MTRKYCLAGICLTVSLLAASAVAQDTFTLYDGNTDLPVVFTNSAGTASTNGTLIVFEGELQAAFSVTNAYNATSDAYLASLQMLTQIRLFDTLPTASEVGDVQGAVAALRDSPEATTGTYYVWGVSNSVLTWMRLWTTNTPATTFAVNENETNYVTFVFSYPTNSDPVTYQVFIGDLGDVVMEPSLPVTSATAETNGINSVSLLGVGALSAVASSSGSTSPLSTAVDFSVYAVTNGIRMDIYTTGESGKNAITVYALINGEWTVVGTIPKEEVVGYGNNHYTIMASGLTVGESYWFKIEDEANHTHSSPTAIQVRSIQMEAVRLDLETLQVTFNTEYGRQYRVMVSESLSAPLAQWTAASVRRYVNGAWTSCTNTPFMAGPEAQTVIQIPLDKNKAFFKVILIDE